MPDKNKPEPAAETELTAENQIVGSEPIKGEHGAQVHLTGDARAAARGGLHGDIISNTMARDAAVGRNEVGDGMTPDGTTPDGHQQPDVKDGADQAKLGEPAKKKPA